MAKAEKKKKKPKKRARPKKKTKAKKAVKKKVKKPKAKKVKKSYFEATGRRKTAVARVRLYQKEKDIIVNDKKLETYFPKKELREVVKSPLAKTEYLDKLGVTAILRGGGIHAQAEALRHGITRALVLFKPALRKQLKKEGYLTRDPRMRERKKFGLKRARRGPQWAKR